MHPHSQPDAMKLSRSSSLSLRQRCACARNTAAVTAAASVGTVLKIAAGLNLLCQHVPSVNALVPSPGAPARTFGSINGGGGHSDDTDVSRFVVGVDSGTWRVARRQGIEMRSTLTPPGVLDRNDGGTQTVREMSEQMSQVRAT